MPAQRHPGTVRSTMADVATAAGVGTGTVSRVLNGGVNVRESTRRRVLEVIERLDYQPSHLAAALSRGTARTVAILVPHLTRPLTVARLAGALTVLDEQGYDTIVYNVDTPEQCDHHLSALTARHRADGVIVVSIRLAKQRIAAFRRVGVPIVTVDATAAGVPQTVIDDVAGTAGNRPPAGSRPPPDRVRGEPPAAPGTSWASPRPGPGCRATGGNWPRPGSTSTPSCPAGHAALVAAELAGELLRLADPPTAIFAASDTQAMGVLRAAQQHGFPVPGRLSVVGSDDIEPAALLNLSTVHQPLEQSGAEGARRLCGLLNGAIVKPLRQQLPLRMMQRTSSAGPVQVGSGGGRSQPLSAGSGRRAHDRGRFSSQAWRRVADVMLPRRNDWCAEGALV